MTRRKATNPSRAAAALSALAAVAVLGALFAAPAGAASGSGNAVIVAADHSKGRTLSGQGVKLLAGSGASSADGKLTLPIGELDPSGNASAKSSGALSFKRGKKSVALSGVHFDLSAGTVDGSLGGTEMAVFKFAAKAAVDSGAGSVSLSAGSLRLTADAAKALKQKLGLARALRNDGVGMLWIAAQASPAQIVRTVVSGSLDWGFKASWRGYILSPPAGSAEVSGGATATGALTSPATTYAFPASKGTFTEGLYGAASKVSLSTGGSVKWAKPAHGINEVRFTDLEIEIDGASSFLIGDVKAEIGPPSESNEVRIAALDVSAAKPVVSADGKTMTWSGIPATLTEAGAASFAGFYSAGTALDPVSITVGLG